MSSYFAIDVELLPQWQQILAHPEPSRADLVKFCRAAVARKSYPYLKRVAALVITLPEFPPDFWHEMWRVGCEMSTLSRTVLMSLKDILGQDTIPQELKLVVEAATAKTVAVKSQSQLRQVALVAVRKRRCGLLKSCLRRLRLPLELADFERLVADIGADLVLLEKLLDFMQPYQELYQSLSQAAAALLSRSHAWPPILEFDHLGRSYRQHTPLGPIMGRYLILGKSRVLLEAVKQGLPDDLVERLLRNMPDSERSSVNLGALMGDCVLAGRAELAGRLPAELGQAHFNIPQAAYEALLTLYPHDSLGSRLTPLLVALGAGSCGLEAETLTQVAMLVVSLATDRQQALEMLNIWRHTFTRLQQRLRWRLVLQVALRSPTFSDGGLPELIQALLDTLIRVGSSKWRRLREVEGQPGAYGVAVDVVEAALSKQA